ncbi:hypothetical protein Droror1_Dr00024019, partial [Drosera rotundifolia]
MKTIFESICALWGQTALKEKETTLREDPLEGSGAAEGSMVKAIEEVDGIDLVPLVHRKRVRESQPSEVVGSTGGMKDQGVQNSTVEPSVSISLCVMPRGRLVLSNTAMAFWQASGVSGIVSDERVEKDVPSTDQAKRIRLAMMGCSSTSQEIEMPALLGLEDPSQETLQ